jgi:WD40 repeat protein
VGAVYDGFISYSHAADDLLAPRLQAGLQRFAKPWWKRRAIRIFRDEASLSANPHLWASIVDAMDGSDWFVLLLSPGAAESEWVNGEVEYWLEHRDKNRIIPVVTDGEFAWGSGDIDTSTDSAPPALYRAFADEPRWVDLRFARTEEQLDLNNASFRAAVADVASAIRGIPKDELESEEVRQHRRTVRAAWAGALVVLAFAALAGAAAFYANGQRLTAEANEAEADTQRQIAQQQTDVAEQQIAVAEQLAVEARADALAATSIARLDADPELSLLLAIESLTLEEQTEALNAMHQALQRHRTTFEITAPPAAVEQGGGATGGLSPDGEAIVIAGHGHTIEVWQVGASEPDWTWETPIPESIVFAPRFTVDGESVVAIATPEAAFDPFREVEDETLFTEASLDRLFVLDAATGAELRSIDIPACPWVIDTSPMPPLVDVGRPVPWATCVPSLQQAEVGLLDPHTGAFSPLARVGVFGAGVPTTDVATRFFAAASGGPGQVIDLSTDEVVFEYEVGVSTLSADASKLLARNELWDLVGNELRWELDRFLIRGWFSRDEELIYGTSVDGTVVVVGAHNGAVLVELVGQPGFLWDVGMADDNGSIASFSDDSSARVWDLAPILSHGATYVTSDQPREHPTGGIQLVGDTAAIWVGAPDREESLWQITVIDLGTGEVVRTVIGGAPALSPDGSRMAYRSVEVVEISAGDVKEGEPGQYPRVGPVHVIDVETGARLLEIDVPCEQYLGDGENLLAIDCPRMFGDPSWQLAFSPDGSLLAMADGQDLAVVWDAETGALVFRAETPGENPIHVRFSPSENHLLVADVSERLRVYDLDSGGLVGSVGTEEIAVFLDTVFTPDGSLLIASTSAGEIVFIDPVGYDTLESIAAHPSVGGDLAINPAGTRIASVGGDGVVKIWNVGDRSLVTEIRFDVDRIAGIEFIDGTHLLVTPGFGTEAIVIALDPDALAEIARSRLTRTFTVEECARFGIDPCPTLEEIKSDSA